MSEPITNAADAVRVLGAVPAPMGPGPQSRSILDRARDALGARMTKDDLRLVLENVINYAAGLEAERHSTNEAFVPQTERSRWVAIADALNAAHAAGMPVGIDIDGTLTDHNAWSVVWDRSAERWTVAGYEGGFPALDEASRKSFAERGAAESDPGRRAAWRMLAEPEPEFHDYLHHDYRDPHDRPETGVQSSDRVVAYCNPELPSVLLCREHGGGWRGLIPLTSEDLPDGGTCTFGHPDEVCGRDVLIDLPGTGGDHSC